MTADLKSQLVLLKTLQDVDVVLHDINRQLEAMPIKIDEAAAVLRASQEEITKKGALKTEIEKKKRVEELEIEAQNARTKERESKLYAIKTNKEYQAAIKEIADAKQATKDREEAIFTMMESIEKISEEITQLSLGIADKENAFREKETGLKQEEELLKLERDEKIALRAEAEKGVDKKVLSEYRLIQHRYSDGMALAINGVCGGCNKRIPPQVFIELMKWKELISCPNCRRLLFFEEAPTQEEA